MRRSPSGRSDALATNHSAITCFPRVFVRCVAVDRAGQYRSAAAEPPRETPDGLQSSGRAVCLAKTRNASPKHAREEFMAETQTEPKLLLPFLRPFYDAVIPFSWLVVRIAVGWNLVVHAWGKIMISPPGDAVLKGYSDLGFTPPELWFWTSTSLEMTAGIALILG